MAILSPSTSSGAHQPVFSSHKARCATQGNSTVQQQSCHLQTSVMQQTPNPHATPAPSQSPHEQQAAPGMEQQCSYCRTMSLAGSQVKEDLPTSVPDMRCIVHENTRGSPRRTDSLAALGFLPPGPGRRLTSSLPVGMATLAPLSP